MKVCTAESLTREHTDTPMLVLLQAIINLIPIRKSPPVSGQDKWVGIEESKTSESTVINHLYIVFFRGTLQWITPQNFQALTAMEWEQFLYQGADFNFGWTYKTSWTTDESLWSRELDGADRLRESHGVRIVLGKPKSKRSWLYWLFERCHRSCV